MTLILLIIILVLLFGGGGYYGHRQGYYGGRGFGGIIGLLVVAILAVYLVNLLLVPATVAPGPGSVTAPAVRP